MKMVDAIVKDDVLYLVLDANHDGNLMGVQASLVKIGWGRSAHENFPDHTTGNMEFFIHQFVVKENWKEEVNKQVTNQRLIGK